MTENQYLDEHLMVLYFEDYQRLVADGDLDPGIDQYLTQINNTSDFRTIFSKKQQFSHSKWTIEGISYIELAYTKRSEDVLGEFLEGFRSELNSDVGAVQVNKNPPDKNVYTQGSNINRKHSYKTNPLHFAVWHYRIEIDSLQKDQHENFFQKLTHGLVHLGRKILDETEHSFRDSA